MKPLNQPLKDIKGRLKDPIKSFNNPIIQELIDKTYAELNAPDKPLQRSRVWTDPEGYKYLVQWSNLVLLRFLLRKLTGSLPPIEFRSKPQLNDAGRSAVRNIEEGYKRPTTSEYLEYIGFTQGSLEEIKGDVRDITQDGFLNSRPGSSLQSIGIDLKDFHEVLKSSKNPLPPFNLKTAQGVLKEKQSKEEGFAFKSLEILYPPLATITASHLTYEIFIELINKTDFLLRKLVESLEKKSNTDQKFYKVEQARIKGKIKGF